MTERVAVLIPVLGRPHRVEPLVKSIRESSLFVQIDPIFVCSPNDDAELDAVRKAVRDQGAQLHVVDWLPGQGDYARKINAAFGRYRRDYTLMLLGADDLDFHPGWVEHAITTWYETGACVIGTNDLGNPRVVKGFHSTHPLVHRNYWECGTIDAKRRIYHDGYWHVYCDDEFVATAKTRGTWAFSKSSVVEHLHYNWGKAAEDDTYRKGNAHFAEDRQMYRKREKLWSRKQ